MDSDEFEKMQNSIVDLESLIRELRLSEAYTLKAANSTSNGTGNTTAGNTTNSTNSTTNNTSTNNTNTDPIVPTPPVDPYANITLNFKDVNWTNVSGKVSPV
jgi:hypothetical protein